MTDVIKAKGYHAKIIANTQDNILEAVGIDISVHAMAENLASLKEEFGISVSEYLALCEERNIEPVKPYSGRYTIDLSPEAHRMVEVASKTSGLSMRRWTAEVLEREAQKLVEQA